MPFAQAMSGICDTMNAADGRAIAAESRRKPVFRGRKVRTPQGSVPDNVRDGRLKAAGRPVQQRADRPRAVAMLAQARIACTRL